jgi:two-component system, OmpR family, response regulator MprA
VSGATTPTRLLVVDDDPALSRTLRRALAVEGYAVDCAADGIEALDRLGDADYDAVVLDVSMPRLDGLAVCRRLRDQRNRTPVLMLTARDAVRDRVSGLDAGADDYLVKPFALDELNARLRALLRRATPEDADERLAYDDLALDLQTFRANRGERALELTRTEHRLLELFLRNPEQVLPRDVIYERVWGYDISLTSNSLDVYVGYLRRKTEEAGEPRVIQTVRGVGFMLAS